jgi:thiamine-phosphate pyrophosphorylase
LHVVTDTRPGAAPLAVVRAAVAAAVRLGAADQLGVQVRVEDDATDREAYQLTVAVLELCRPAGVLCLVNDRLQVALAAGADGGHVGADDLPVAAARRVLDGSRLFGDGSAGGAQNAVADGRGSRIGVLGATCRTPEVARAAVADGASYLGVGPAFRTTTKRGLPDAIGAAGVGAVARVVPGTPVIAIGGVAVAGVPELMLAGAHGVAVVGALSSAADPERATTDLLRALTAAAVAGTAVAG